jgi:hypothetical protein
MLPPAQTYPITILFHNNSVAGFGAPADTNVLAVLLLSSNAELPFSPNHLP